MSRIAVAALAAILVTLTTVSRAEAEVIVGSFYSEDDSVSFSFVGTPQGQHVDVDVSGDPLKLWASEGALVYGDCDVGEPGYVVCLRYDGDYLGELRGGDDRVTVTGLMDGEIGLGAGDDEFVDGSGDGDSAGGLGKDRMDGGFGDDAIRGGAGRDRLRGGAGRDRVNGEAGRDVLLGGAGSDRVLADDNRRDRAIDCGPGNDRVLIDAGLDPRPRHCEEVRKR